MAPEPIVLPSALAGGYADNNAQALAAIKAAQALIDGPRGWVGLCFGPQTLELTTGASCDRIWRLPCPPIISIVSLQCRDGAGAMQTIDPSSYTLWGGEGLWLNSGYSLPALSCFPDNLRIQYRAGYDDAITGPIPEEAKRAVAELAQDLLTNASSGSPRLRSETVEGIGAQSFMDGDKASAMVSANVDRLLSGLRVYSL